MDKVIYIRMPDDLHSAVQRLAQADDRPVASYVRRMLEKAVEANAARVTADDSAAPV